MALVEPVLRTLGWDTGNPLEVQPEYTLTGGNGRTHQADLMLFMGTAGRWAAVDVIPLGHEPHPEEMDHLVKLCRETQTPLATVTNGTSWWFRTTENPPGGQETSVDLMEQPEHHAALGLLILWHGGSRKRAASPPAGSSRPGPPGSRPAARRNAEKKRRNIMPEVTIPVMDEEELKQFGQAAQVILLAQADGLCRFDIGEDEEGHRVEGRLVADGFHRREEIQQALETVREALAQGRAMVTTDRQGRRSLAPAEITRRHAYPIAHMTEQEEEEEFNLDARAVNEAMMRRECNFESLLDDDARVYFRYSIADGAENRQELLDRIHRIVDHVHSGRALRIEMPGGGVMLMPRWHTPEEKGQDTQTK